MDSYYPVFLSLKGKPCVVIGGGEVAERKVRSLLESGASVSLISPKSSPVILEMVGRGEMQWNPRQYADGDLKGAFLAIAATDRREVNEAIAEEATREGMLLNVVDVPHLCTFIAPAVVKRGEVSVAISTGGASPALARKIKESLKDADALEYAHLAGILSSARTELKRQGIQVHPDRWQRCINQELVAIVKDGRTEEALDRLMSALTQSSTIRARAPS